MTWLFWIVVGGIAGWIAEQVTNANHGIFTNIIVGIAGAFIGGWLFSALGITLAAGWIGSIVTALAGALILLYGLRFIRRKT